MTANMKTSELRLGNLVLNSWGENSVEVTIDILMSLESMGSDSKYKPIPLTEEWLLKFGFTICENEAWYEKKIPTLGILIACNLHGRFCIEHTDELVTIRDCCYKVHELQNLYFALVGEELTFKSE